MTEGGFTPEELSKDLREAAKLVGIKKGLIDNPLARFNLNMDGTNPDLQPKDKNIKGETLEPIPDPTPSPELLKEMDSPVMVEVGLDQRLNTFQLNWEFRKTPEDRVLVVLPSYNNAIGESATRYRMQEVARQNQVPVLAIDHPGMGSSDPLTEAQKQALKDNGRGDLSEVAKAEVEVLKKLGITNIDLVGQSLGGFMAAHIAREAVKQGIDVRYLVVVESPGIEEFKFLDAVGRLLGTNKYLGLYSSTPYDPEMRLAANQHKSSLKRNVDGLKWIASSRENDPNFIYAKAMTRKILPDILDETLSLDQNVKVVLAHGTISRASPAEANHEMVENLKSRFKGRVRRALFPGEPHVVMEDAKRFGSFVNLMTQRSQF